jgi:hypothetical protein
MKLDENGDGVISFDEFYAWWTTVDESSLRESQAKSTDSVLKLRLKSSVLMRSVSNLLKRAEGRIDT